MVRTQYSPFAFRFDPSRILALSTAIALHLLALLLLLIPLTQRTPLPVPSVPTPRWQIPVTLPAPPVPLPLEPSTPQPPQPLVPIHQAAPQTPTALPAATSTEAALAEPAAEPTTTPATDTGPATDLSPTLPGASLQYLQAPPPTYPRSALLDRLEGTVLLQVHVDINGQPIAVDIARSSGHHVLDRAARDQVLKRWRFRPALSEGQPVEAVGLVPVAFSLSR
ncbi:MAG TPA: TonB family protein [Stenotrophomonas sp.]|nr:TonB family protein [Stenotrophomonas sp.]